MSVAYQITPILLATAFDEFVRRASANREFKEAAPAIATGLGLIVDIYETSVSFSQAKERVRLALEILVREGRNPNLSEWETLQRQTESLSDAINQAVS